MPRFLGELLVSLAVGAGLTALLYWPIVMTSGVEAIVSNKWVAPKSTTGFLADVPRHLAYLWQQWSRDLPDWLSVALAVGAIICTVRYRRCADHRVSIVAATVIWVVPVTIARRVMYISPRIWLYLLPIYFALGASGLCDLASWLGGRAAGWAQGWARRSVPWVAVGLSAWVGCHVLWSQSVLRSIDTGVAPDAEAVVLFLKEHRRPHDKMVMIDLQVEPIFYYCWLHDISFKGLTTNFDVTDRLWLILGDQKLHTLEEAVALIRPLDPRIRAASFPVLAATLGGTQIYQMDPPSKANPAPASAVLPGRGRETVGHDRGR